MKFTTTLLFMLFVPFAGIAETNSYCTDAKVISDWNEKAQKYSHSDDWQRLHALWIGLCQKAKDGSITLDRAIQLFEFERQHIIGREKRRQNTAVNPFG
jgi:hypothetical protein